ncbi:ABC transporter permease [Methanohalobium sp.]|uniref:ABC transporter permease n=1 Tax=Methanohalobium sp. TaxID=2837493 RepID=UPI0025E85B7B|nr:ABC transporter permease [Methanohalobium sp.]
MVTLETIANATLQHVILVYLTLIASIVISIPLAFISVESEKLANWIMKVTNLLQAVPSFAVVAIVVPLIGIGFIPALIAILVRALLPIVKNTYIGLFNIDPSLIDYAHGVGLTRWQINRYIRLPNSYPAIFAGVRFSALLANSIAVLTALIGGGGLGKLVFEGLVSFNIDRILAGAIPAILLALASDSLLAMIEKKLTPVNLRE